VKMDLVSTTKKTKNPQRSQDLMPVTGSSHQLISLYWHYAQGHGLPHKIESKISPPSFRIWKKLIEMSKFNSQTLSQITLLSKLYQSWLQILQACGKSIASFPRPTLFWLSGLPTKPPRAAAADIKQCAVELETPAPSSLYVEEGVWL